MSGRGRGGKFSKPKRGGGKHFSRNLQPINQDGEIENMWGERSKKAAEDGDSSSEEDSSEEESSEEEGSSKQPLTREERKAAARKRKEAAIAKKTGKAVGVGDLPSSEEDSDDDEDDDDDMPANPNHTASAAKQASAVPTKADVEGGEDAGAKKKVKNISQLSRREKEALQAQQAKERYQKLHLEGKTDEAKNDMERLKLVRERRDAEAARKKAEAEERAEHDKEKADQLARMERQQALKASKLGNKKKK